MLASQPTRADWEENWQSASREEERRENQHNTNTGGESARYSSTQADRRGGPGFTDIQSERAKKEYLVIIRLRLDQSGVVNIQPPSLID